MPPEEGVAKVSAATHREMKRDPRNTSQDRKVLASRVAPVRKIAG